MIRIVLLLLATFGTGSIQARARETEIFQAINRLYFLYNGSLYEAVYLIPEKKFVPWCRRLVDDAVDYSIDEGHSRLYWSASNGSLYLKSLAHPDAPIKRLPAGQAGSLSYDAITDRLYLENAAQRQVCLASFNTETFTDWIDRVDYTGVISMGRESAIEKIVQDTDLGVGFILKEADRSKIVYRFEMDGSNMTLIIEYMQGDQFDIDYQTKKLFWIDNDNIESSNYDGTERTIVLKSEPNITSFTVDNNRLFWSTFTTGPSSRNVLKMCQLAANGACSAHMRAEWSFEPGPALEKLGLYRLTRGARPCTSQADCANGCLLGECWPFRVCECREGRCAAPLRHRRQSPPFDMYSQQPTLRPEPQATPPDISYLPFYLYPGK